MILLKPSLYGFKKEQSYPADYVVENCENHFFIHRVVPITERFFYNRDKLLITPEGKYLVPNIGRGESFEEAQEIVLSLWRTVMKANERLNLQ
ncbi:hypothetical protein [Paenibacillus polymyxa]|uniref:hypothetical protein n=1 Tax=Paenibacillus polymyxa TaxID=1406 RepID=UPI0004DF593D|nr:hypothetical protein [Paenibacillus polymyxa]RPE06728.1 hypothetical protein EG487_08050 [Paenibacillus polymyxa]